MVLCCVFVCFLSSSGDHAVIFLTELKNTAVVVGCCLVQHVSFVAADSNSDCLMYV